MLNNFIYAQSKAMFEERLHEVPNDAIVFIEDTKEIWNHGHYFAGDCGFDPTAFSNLQTAVSQIQTEFLPKSGGQIDGDLLVTGELSALNFDAQFATISTAVGDVADFGSLILHDSDDNAIVDFFHTNENLAKFNKNVSIATATNPALSISSNQQGYALLVERGEAAFLDGITVGNVMYPTSSTFYSSVDIKSNLTVDGTFSALDTLIVGRKTEDGDIATFVDVDGSLQTTGQLIADEGVIGYGTSNFNNLNASNVVAGTASIDNVEIINLTTDDITVKNTIGFDSTPEIIYRSAHDEDTLFEVFNVRDVSEKLSMVYDWGNHASAGYITSAGSITGNAATATKLKNSVTIWGNSFDGNNSIAGNINLGNGIAITSSKFNNSTTKLNLMQLNGSNLLLIGQGIIGHGDTYLYGQNIVFKTGTTGTGTQQFNMDSNGVSRFFAPVATRKRLRVESDNQVGNTVSHANFGFIDVHTSISSSHSTGNVGVMTIGTNYGGGTTIDNYIEGTDLSGAGGINHTAMTVYRKQVGIGRLFTDDEMRAIYEKNKSLGVGGLSVAGCITADSTITANAGVFSSSDERLKNFGEAISVDLDKLKTLRKNYFTWKDGKHSGNQIGVSAQEIQAIYPEIVGDDLYGNLTVAYDKLSVVALAAIDKLYEENQELKARLDKLENK